MSDFPAEKGTYILLLHLDDATMLTVGKLGTFAFPGGWYTYVGSAFGAGGLRGRLNYHLTPVKRPHWHIDYLRAVAPVRVVWYRADTSRYEHTWAAALLAAPSATVPVRRFGASDCRCAAHLIHFVYEPTGAMVRGWIGNVTAPDECHHL